MSLKMEAASLSMAGRNGAEKTGPHTHKADLSASTAHWLLMVFRRHQLMELAATVAVKQPCRVHSPKWSGLSPQMQRWRGVFPHLSCPIRVHSGVRSTRETEYDELVKWLYSKHHPRPVYSFYMQPADRRHQRNIDRDHSHHSR